MHLRTLPTGSGNPVVVELIPLQKPHMFMSSLLKLLHLSTKHRQDAACLRERIKTKRGEMRAKSNLFCWRVWTSSLRRRHQCVFFSEVISSMSGVICNNDSRRWCLLLYKCQMIQLPFSSKPEFTDILEIERWLTEEILMTPVKWIPGKILL